jgi:hypothetical protein
MMSGIVTLQLKQPEKLGAYRWQQTDSAWYDHQIE